MGDENIKSRLLSDEQWLLLQSGRKEYTWDRAEETLRFIRRLGSTREGLTYLDKLRQVVTQIGNALGYVRMVRSAGRRASARSLPYVEGVVVGPRGVVKVEKGEGGESCEPSGEVNQDAPEDRLSLFAFADAADCPDMVLDAARDMDDSLRSVRTCFESDTDYLNLVAQVFGIGLRSMRDEADSAAKLFHFLVPAMTLSFVESLLQGREALLKRVFASAHSMRNRNAIAFDDGFAVGVACLLRIFGSEQDFQALHWFDVPTYGAEQGPTSEVKDPTVLHGLAEEKDADALRRETLKREMGTLAATLEAALSLFNYENPK